MSRSYSGTKRQQKILEHLQRTGSASVQYLARACQVAPMTIRRDLETLSEQGLVRRYFGGAFLDEGMTEPPRRARLSAWPEEKERIGAQTARYLRGSESVILDAGSTTYAVAVAMLDDPWEVTVITNDPHIALLLGSGPDAISIMLVGGLLRRNTLSTVGDFGRQLLEVVHAEVAVMATNGVSLEHGVMNSNVLEWSIKRTMVQSARRCVLVADHTKLQTASLYTYAPWSAFELVVTGIEADPQKVRAVSDCGVQVRTV